MDPIPTTNSSSSDNENSPTSISSERNKKAVTKLNKVLNEAGETIIESTAQNIQDLTNVDTSFLTKLGSKNNLDSISNLLIDKVIQNIPTDHNKKPIVEISTIWDILDITMIIVVNLKNKTQISGIQAKNIVLRILYAIVNDFTEEPEKDICLNLLKNSIPHAIDLIIKAKKGKLDFNSKILDFTGDDKLDLKDLSLCTRLCKNYCCCKL